MVREAGRLHPSCSVTRGGRRYLGNRRARLLELVHGLRFVRNESRKVELIIHCWLFIPKPPGAGGSQRAAEHAGSPFLLRCRGIRPLSGRRQTQANNFFLIDGHRRNYLTQPSVSLRQAAPWGRMSKKVSTATSSSASSLAARLDAVRVEQQLNCRGRRSQFSSSRMR